MKLSTKGQYSIKAMINLAINYNSPVTLIDLSKFDSISISYLEQLFSTLRRSGLVQGVRGPGGGYRLGKSPDKISIADIITAIEEPSITKKSDECSDTEQSETVLANTLWDELSDQLLSYLDSITLADIIKDHIVIKSQYKLNETTRRISTMFPVSANLKVA